MNWCSYFCDLLKITLKNICEASNIDTYLANRRTVENCSPNAILQQKPKILLFYFEFVKNRDNGIQTQGKHQLAVTLIVYDLHHVRQIRQWSFLSILIISGLGMTFWRTMFGESSWMNLDSLGGVQCLWKLMKLFCQLIHFTPFTFDILHKSGITRLILLSVCNTEVISSIFVKYTCERIGLCQYNDSASVFALTISVGLLFLFFYNTASKGGNRLI